MGEHPRFWVAFIIMLLAFAFFTVMSVVITIQAHASTGPVTISSVIDIDNDGGGNVLAYYKKYKAISEAGATVRIHGYCASACTLLLMREYTGIKACAVDEDAVFAFHKPFAFDKRHRILKTKEALRISREMWVRQLVELPYDAYKILKDAHIPSATEGDDPNDVFVVPAIFFVPRCEAVK